MLERDKNFIDPEEDAEETTTLGYDTEDDAPNDEELPPKDENEN